MTLRHWYHVLFYSLIPSLVLLMRMSVANDSSAIFTALILLYMIVAPVVAFVLMILYKRQGVSR